MKRKRFIIKNIALFGGVNAIASGLMLLLLNIPHWYLWTLIFFAAFCVGFLRAKLDCYIKPVKKYRKPLSKLSCWFMLFSFLCLVAVHLLIGYYFFSIDVRLLDNIFICFMSDFLGRGISLYFITPFVYKYLDNGTNGTDQ